jgi:hypothetical protein
MTMPFWPDILTRLGPSEIYAVPAVLLFAYGLMTNTLWMIVTGYVVSVGSKENFLILLPVLALWLGYRIFLKKVTKQEIWTSVALLGYTAFIVGGIMIATAKAGTDIYGAQISYRYRITKLIWDIPMIIKTRHIMPALAVMAVALFAKTKPWKYILGMLGLLALISSQYIFYVNQIPTNMRYDFPVMLLFPVLDLVAVKLVIALSAKHRLHKLITYALYIMIIAGCSLYVLKRGYTLIHLQAEKVVRASTAFNQQLSLAKKVIAENPGSTINFVSSRYIDFEPIVSVERYLTAAKITNSFSLYYNPEISPTDPMELDDRLKSVMKGEVSTDHLFDRFSAYREEHVPCLSITFNGAVPPNDCPTIANF